MKRCIVITSVILAKSITVENCINLLQTRSVSVSKISNKGYNVASDWFLCETGAKWTLVKFISNEILNFCLCSCFLDEKSFFIEGRDVESLGGKDKLVAVLRLLAESNNPVYIFSETFGNFTHLTFRKLYSLLFLVRVIPWVENVKKDYQVWLTVAGYPLIYLFFIERRVTVQLPPFSLF